MATATDVLRIATAEIGYDRYQDPEEGTKYGRWYAQSYGSYFGTTGVPYCAMYTSWCFYQAGAKCAGLPAASTRVIYNAAKAAGKLRGNVRDAQPGDVLLFDWTASGTNSNGDPNNLSHTCMCELNRGDDGVQTVEGNVSNGKVARRVRSWAYVAAAVIPDFDTEKPASESTTDDSQETENDDMNCIINWNDEGKLVWFDGSKLHWLDEPDTAEAVRMVYRNTHNGKEIPEFTMGQEGAPWASRFGEALFDCSAELSKFIADHE